MASRKLIELLIDEDTENFGVEAISLVKYPAIESNFIHFSKHRGRRSMYAMAQVDADKRTLIGPALIPDKNIPRYDEFSDEEYDVYFSKSTVQQASELFLKNNYANNHTFEHQDPVDGVSVVESWIVTNPEMDKSRHFGLEVPEGTWMVRVHVANDEMWNFVKENKVSGFSIEGYFVDRVENMSEKKKDDGIVRKIQKMLSGRKFYAEIQTDDGQTLATENDKFEAGAEVYKIGPEGTALELSDGKYMTKAGTPFEVFEGVVTDWDGNVKEVEQKAEEQQIQEMKKDMKRRYNHALNKVQSRREEFMTTNTLAEIEYYDEGGTVLRGWEAEEFVMNEFSYEMSNDIQIVYISGISRGIWVGEREYDVNQPMWDAYEYARQYSDSKV